MSLFRRNSLPIPNNDEYPSQSILLNPIPPSQQQQRSSSRTRSIRSASITSSSSQSNSMASCSYTPSSSAKVSFAPLPEVPPELKRRNSITLGVAARKNLLIGQGSAPVQRSPGVPNSNGVRKVYMTDEEWEEYKKAFDKKNGADAVDLGELAKSGAKNLWRKVRSSSVSSTTSASSFQSGSPNSQTSDLSVMNATQPKVLASPRRLFGNRKLSTPSRSSGDVLGFNDPRMAVEELGTVHEEERSRPTSPRISGLELDTGVHPHSINLATGAPALSPTRESIEEWRNTSKSSDPDQEQVSPSDLPVRRRSPPPLPAQSFDEEDEDESDLVSERAS